MPISEQSITPLLRRAIEDDLDFLVWIDVHGEGEDPSYMAAWTDAERSDHRLKMLGFICDDDKFAFVLQSGDCSRIGGICGRRINIRDDLPSWSVFHQLDASLFPKGGRLCEIFQLWVDPNFRRRGLASQLKIEAENEARRNGLEAIYTHTKASNEDVIALNVRLGYREIRRGPIWDNTIRVSLLKNLAIKKAKFNE